MTRIRSAYLSLLLVPLAATAGDKIPAGLGRQILPANDGWASLPTIALPNGTTGGSAAAPSRVHRVRDRNQLVAALAFPDATPKIIEIEGVIDGNVGVDGAPLSCADYARPDPQTGEMYSLAAFLAAYDPSGPWGRVNPSGPLERARLDIRPSATPGNQAMNVIVRNLSFEDTYDCFPQWSPTDGAQGNWNAQYDAISIRNSTHVWIDHNRFADVTTADATLPVHFGRLYQVHDGLLDVTNESDLVTISWNRFSDHDKTMLVGSSDSATVDRGKLRITLHHNLFQDLGQRVPRVRYGRVHVYNNHYKISDTAAAAHYGYSWGVGVESAIYAENNHFRVGDAITPDLIVERLNGQALHATGTLLDGVSAHSEVDVVAAFNATNGNVLGTDVGWTPTLHGPVEPAGTVPVAVLQNAGPFK